MFGSPPYCAGNFFFFFFIIKVSGSLGSLDFKLLEIKVKSIVFVISFKEKRTVYVYNVLKGT